METTADVWSYVVWMMRRRLVEHSLPLGSINAQSMLEIAAHQCTINAQSMPEIAAQVTGNEGKFAAHDLEHQAPQRLLPIRSRLEDEILAAGCRHPLALRHLLLQLPPRPLEGRVEEFDITGADFAHTHQPACLFDVGAKEDAIENLLRTPQGPTGVQRVQLLLLLPSRASRPLPISARHSATAQHAAIQSEEAGQAEEKT